MSNELIRNDFPIFKQEIRGKSLVYLDNGATTQKPQCVIDAIKYFYENDYANIHRGVYELSQRATHLFENVRKKVKQFIHAKDASEIIFTKGTTEAINLVASCLSFEANDEIILSVMEHHSNIVPWQMLCEKTGAKIKVVPLLENGELDFSALEQLFSSRTKLLSITHVSNVLGTVNPIRKLAQLAHAYGAKVLIDGAQAIAHLPVDVQELDCDFYVFSSHKMYGPTGVGILYGKADLLEMMSPYQGGGDMIERVSFEKTTFNKLPYKFEAGTPNIADVIGFGAAIDYLNKIGIGQIITHEQTLLEHTTHKLQTIPGLKIIGTPPNKIGVISFVMEQAHPHDIATVLDHEGVAVRAGHHCAMPLMDYLKVPATLRVSLGIYNTFFDIDRLLSGLKNVQRLFVS